MLITHATVLSGALLLTALFCEMAACADPAPPDASADPRSLPSRIGVVFQSKLPTGFEKLHASWYMRYDHLGRGTDKLEYVPILWYSRFKSPLASVPPELKDPDSLRAYIEQNSDRYPHGTLWLIGNEIGYKPARDPRSPEHYARDYHDAYNVLKSLDRNYRVAHGAIITTNRAEITAGYVGGRGGIAYLEQVLEKYRTLFNQQMPIDVFNIHVYASNIESGSTDLEDVKAQVFRFRKFMKKRGYQDHPLIISELGCPLGTAPPDEIGQFLTAALPALLNLRSEQLRMKSDDYRLVQRIAWFIGARPEHPEHAPAIINFPQTTLLDENGELTPLGKAFNATVRRLSQ